MMPTTREAVIKRRFRNASPKVVEGLIGNIQVYFHDKVFYYKIPKKFSFLLLGW